MQYVTEAEIRRYGSEVYEVIPPQFRERIPAGVRSSEHHAELLRTGFELFRRTIDQLMMQLEIRPGERWDLWKTIAIFYLVEHRVGKATATRVGTNVFKTFIVSSGVRNVAEAFRKIEPAYRRAHEGTMEESGGWPIVVDEPGRIVIDNRTFYPCSLEEGTVAGVCTAFRNQLPSYRIVNPPPPKREGGLFTRYEILFVS